MDTVFEGLFFLAIALLAITVTVFVLAVSLLGRAVKISLEEQERMEKERKRANTNEIEKIQKELNLAKDEGKHLDIKSLGKILRNLNKKDKKHDRVLRWIKWKPKFLTANWGVFVPGLFFIIVIGISALARYQLDQFNTNFQYLYLGLSLFALSFGAAFICLTLKVIEGVAITSDETALVRTKDMYKAAFIEIEREKKPEIELRFKDENPPFHFNIGQVKTLSVGLALKHGEAARNPIIGIAAPKGFSFPGQKETPQPKDSPHPGYVSTSIHCQTCVLGYIEQHDFIIKAPDQKGAYKLYWNIYCENLTQKEIEIKIIVE